MHLLTWASTALRAKSGEEDRRSAEAVLENVQDTIINTRENRNSARLCDMVAECIYRERPAVVRCVRKPITNTGFRMSHRWHCMRKSTAHDGLQSVATATYVRSMVGLAQLSFVLQLVNLSGNRLGLLISGRSGAERDALD